MNHADEAPLKLVFLFAFLATENAKEKKEKMRKNKLYTIDLARIKGNGTIRCPKCGYGISPDDASEQAYTIIEPVMEDDRLEKIRLQCNGCGSKINLVGFNTITKKVHRQN